MQPDVLTAHDRDFRAYTWNYEAKTIGELIEGDGERGGGMTGRGCVWCRLVWLLSFVRGL